MDGHDLLSQLRDEAYHLRVLTRQLRNQSKTLAAAYFDAEQRLERLIEQIENPTPKEAQGEHESRQQDSMEATERRGATHGGISVRRHAHVSHP